MPEDGRDVVHWEDILHPAISRNNWKGRMTKDHVLCDDTKRDEVGEENGTRHRADKK